MSVKAGLYIVATPIGNLGDITLRGLETIKASDLLLCEDTRVSKKLLEKYAIDVPMRFYNDHNDEDVVYDIVAGMISSGRVVSLISDAGTPLICDPGYKLVRRLRQNGFYVDVVPGACAAIAALSIAGLPSWRFFFGGFVPRTAPGKMSCFEELKDMDATLVFFEAPRRLMSTLEIARLVFGNRECAVARELTKLRQDVALMTLDDQIAKFAKFDTSKGEAVLIIAGSGGEPTGVVDFKADVAKMAADFLALGVSAKEATAKICDALGVGSAKSEVYAIVNAVKKGLR